MNIELTPDVIRVLSEGLNALNDGDASDRKAMHACEKLLASQGVFLEYGELCPIEAIRYGYISSSSSSPEEESIFVMKDADGRFVSAKVAVPTEYTLFFDEERTILVKAAMVYPPGYKGRLHLTRIRVQSHASQYHLDP